MGVVTHNVSCVELFGEDVCDWMLDILCENLNPYHHAEKSSNRSTGQHEQLLFVLDEAMI